VVAFAQRGHEANRAEAQTSGAPEIARPRNDRAWQAAAAARVEAARFILDDLMDQQGHNTLPPDDKASKSRLLDAIPTWSRRLMEERVRQADHRATRLAALREHRDRMNKLELLYNQLLQGRSSTAASACSTKSSISRRS
jgi:hypothetical protein